MAMSGHALTYFRGISSWGDTVNYPWAFGVGEWL